MNGNVTKEGIRLDLEWMRRVGIGGVQQFDVELATPKVVKERLLYMTPQWDDAFRYAVTLADDLGMEFGVASGPGFSVSGAPWVSPKDGMKKVVWTEMRVEGGATFSRRLPSPPSISGPFQNVPWINPVPGTPGPKGGQPTFYKDIAVLAYPLPAEDVTLAEMHPTAMSSNGPIDASLLWDSDFTSAVSLPYPPGGRPAWIELDLGRPQTVSAMSLTLQAGQYFGTLLAEAAQPAAELLSSIDGKVFRRVASVPATKDVEQTIAFSPRRARFFRLALPTPPRAKAPEVLQRFSFHPATEHRVAEFVLYSLPRIDHSERKAGFFVDDSGTPFQPVHLSARQTVRPSDVIDLTALMGPDGSLTWSAPPGRWAILRLGYSLLGTTNHPAPAEATGLEVDKLSHTAVKAYIDRYLGHYDAILGPGLVGMHGLRALLNDSWEAEAQNWSDDLPKQFAKRRGYELWRWLPTLTGRVIGSGLDAERFLWDFRRTLSELLTESYYDQLSAELHLRGMIHYGEAHEAGRAFIGDGMDVKRGDDIPMGAMWSNEELVSHAQSDADLRESASVAHIYGQNIAAAESLTTIGEVGSAFALSPERVKPIVDRELADGINRFVIHAAVHQPLTAAGPGVTLGPIGEWFTRNETWAEKAQAWVMYLARSSFLLQQGHFVADVLYFYGQDTNITALYGQHLPALPEGYAFDFANVHALTTLSVHNGEFIARSGMRYRILVLDPRTSVMSLDVLRQIARLVAEGGVVVGNKPGQSPSLADSMEEFQRLTNQVWGSDGQRRHQYEKGWVLSGRSFGDSVAELQLMPDFAYTKPKLDTKVEFVHRRLDDGEIYLLVNRQARPEEIEARFRITGRAAEIWHADSGLIEPAPFRQEGPQTIVPVSLEASGTEFVVFRTTAEDPVRLVALDQRETVTALTGPWQVSFQLRSGAVQKKTFTRLASWSRSADPNIKYYSGTARYDTHFKLPATWRPETQRLELDLGAVESIAEVLVNGEAAGVVWKRPYRLDITNWVKLGTNSLTVRVSNLWVNRLIGDKQSRASTVAFTTFNPYTAKSKLFNSGLLGPVSIVGITGALVPKSIQGARALSCSRETR